jgi:hypothetical protein
LYLLGMGCIVIFCSRDFIYMRNTKKAQMGEWERMRESSLLAVLNLGLKEPIGWIKSDIAEHPENWTEDVQFRVTELSRLAIDTLDRLSALPALRRNESGNEIIRREEMVRPLNHRFGLCMVTPAFVLDLSSGQALLLSESLNTNFANVVEGTAMIALRDLIKRGEIQRLRECGNPSCKAWYLAERREQKWCSSACRQAMYQSTETFKERRRANYAAKKRLPASKRKKVKTNAKKSR